MKPIKKTFFKLSVLFFVFCCPALAQKDYKLWLQYEKKTISKLTSDYLSNIKGIVVLENTETLKIAENELHNALNDMLGNDIQDVSKLEGNNTIILGSKLALSPEIQKAIGSGFALITVQQDFQ